MKTRKLELALLGVALTLTLGIGTALAQSTESDDDSHNVVITIVERAMLDLSSTDDVTFTIDVIVAGEPGDRIEVIDSANTDNKYLRYTSIVAGLNETRKITVEIDDAANIPAGTTLEVEADDPTASGQGNRGTAVAGKIDLRGTEGAAADVVTGIRSASTGRGAGQGVKLTYTLEIDDDDDAVADLVADTYTVVVTYTLTESE